MLKQLISAAVLFVLLGTAAQAQTPTVIYDNLGFDNPPNGYDDFFGNLGATPRNLNTDLIADDINPIDGTAGYNVTQFSFVVGNAGMNAVTASIHVSFYDDFNPDLSGGPGTYIGGVDFNSSTFLPQDPTTGLGGLYLETYTAPAGTTVFTIPSDQSFWAGVSFSANPGTSADDLNNLGPVLAGPPSVGGSDDLFFISGAQGSNTFDNPPGGEYDSSIYGGGPPANFAWQFLATPEPSQFIGMGLGVLGLGGLALRARKRNANA